MKVGLHGIWGSVQVPRISWHLLLPGPGFLFVVGFSVDPAGLEFALPPVKAGRPLTPVKMGAK